MSIPIRPKLYHIVHVDRLPSILAGAGLWCDAEVSHRQPSGTTIGMSQIKQRRLHELTLTSHSTLRVGDCVPFYFCPRSIMLYLIHRANHPALDYHGGQRPIIHLEADLYTVTDWADAHDRRWAFTLSNAGARYFEDRCQLSQLGEIDWSAVQATSWHDCKEGKQAEFLLEYNLPWPLVERIGVIDQDVYNQVMQALSAGGPPQPPVEVCRQWYY